MSTTQVTPEVTQNHSETQVAITKKKSIFDNAACLSVGRKWPSLTKTLSKDFLVVNKADKSRLHASKDLYSSNALRKLANLEIGLDATLKRYGLPFPLKTGVYILGLDLYNEVEAILSKHAEDRQPLINEFCNSYDEEVAKAKEFQGDAFDPSDYSTGEAVKKEFKFEWHYLTMDVAENLSKVGKDVLAREQAKMETVWQDARDAAQIVMREQFRSLVTHLFERLTPGEEGKKKIFRNTVFDPINEYAKHFDPRNLAEDSDLKLLVEQAKKLVEGVSPEELRSNEALKASLQKGFADIKVTLDSMIVDAPMRHIELEEETVVEGEAIVQ